MLPAAMTLSTPVSQSIISAIAATASAAITVSIVVNQVYALGLPCADEPKHDLSAGAKAGIGIGVSIGGLILLSLILFIGFRIGRKKVRHGQNHTSFPEPPEMHTSPGIGTMATPSSTGSPYMAPKFQPLSHAYDFPVHPSSWGSQASSVPPQYGSPAVELQATIGHEVYEIGGTRTACPKSPYMSSGAASILQDFKVSVHGAQPEQWEGKLFHN
jgi:hypothetical protein